MAPIEFCGVFHRQVKASQSKKFPNREPPMPCLEAPNRQWTASQGNAGHIASFFVVHRRVVRDGVDFSVPSLPDLEPRIFPHLLDGGAPVPLEAFPRPMR
jgi:hypothetical protein